MIASGPTQSLPIAPTEESRGVLIELSGLRAHAITTATVAMIRQAQSLGETAAWILSMECSPFAPDLHSNGIDLNAVVFIRVPTGQRRWIFKNKAAEILVRSGAYGIVVVDLRDESDRALHHTAWQSRLWGLARQYQSQIVLLSKKSEHDDSLGPLIGLRMEPKRTRKHPGQFRIDYKPLKNKASMSDLPPLHMRGPWGLS